MQKLMFATPLIHLIVFLGFATIELSAQDPAAAKAIEHIPAQTVASISVWPKKLASSERMRLAPLEVLSAAGIENVGLDPLRIDRIDVFVGMPGPTGPQFGALIQTSEVIDVEAINPQLLDGNGLVTEEGFKFVRLDSPEELIVHQLDANAAIFGTPVFVKQMVGAADPNGQIAQINAGIRAEQDVLAVVSVSSLRPLLRGVSQMAPEPIAEDVAIVVDATEFIALRLLMADEEKLQLVVSAIDKAGAGDAATSLGRIIEFTQQQIIIELKDEIPNDTLTARAMHAYIDRMGEEVLGALKPEQAGNRLVYELQDFQNASVIGTLTGLLLPAVQSARFAGRRMQSANNLKQLGLALHNFADAYNSFPATAGLDDDGEPMISWRVAILPFVEEAELYQRFNLDEPWDSDHNIALLEEMPDVFKHPSRPTDPGYTVYQAPVGDETLLRLKEPTGFRDITDGTSNTILLVETIAEKAVPWTAPQDYEVDLDDPKAGLFDSESGQFLFGDGSVQTIAESIAAGVLKALFTRAGGEVVDFP